MSRSKLIIIAGFLVALLPILGFPQIWEAIFQVFVGLAIVGLSVWTTIDRKISLKAKARERAINRRSTDLYSKPEQPSIPPNPEI